MNGTDDLDSGLLGIALSDSDAEPGDEASSKKPSQEARTGQSEADFQEVKRTYQVKVENGEIWKTVRLPLGPQRVPKPEHKPCCTLWRSCTSSGGLPRVHDDDAGTGKLDDDTLQTLVYYEKKCSDKMNTI
ncbi:hypothetical protein RRF57_007918 [Xylaria bambusicola]|uniref:Uncharacterized protein n=1 Tax=Xylaria bambusicola TaxID=326684 RepID=A0AAN7UW55_9PEZI